MTFRLTVYSIEEENTDGQSVMQFRLTWVNIGYQRHTMKCVTESMVKNLLDINLMDTYLGGQKVEIQD